MKLSSARWAHNILLCSALLGLSPLAQANSNLNQPPAQVTQTIENARLMGYGTFRWFGLRVYDGQLWANTAAEGFDYKRDPSWLELKYARDFKGSDIADRSISEMKEIGAGTEAQREEWMFKLNEIFPDVRKGHTLSALFTPGKNLQFFRNGQLLATLNDPALAEAFMGIWLDPKTSSPDMRLELMGLKR